MSTRVCASVEASEAQCSEYLWAEKLMGQNSLDKNEIPSTLNMFVAIDPYPLQRS